MKKFNPQTGSTEEWTAAHDRLEEYFRAHRFVDRVLQSELILCFLERAAARHALDPRQSPTTLALQEMNRAVAAWFAQVLDRKDLPEERQTIAGRVALYRTDAPQKWPGAFLSGEVPEECVRALRTAALQAGPDLQISSMVPRPVEGGPIVQAIEETLVKAEKIVWARACLVGGGMGAWLWYLVS